ncbi:MFS transporter [Kribbella sp. CA-293567]|uniref:MFS transporter n=1 Tax=Kribbella sp. CA-293567 TaxID=3002436 RepID=UPI0022DE17C8|nr:MFS transporter [Kribbella sp. CA-293567]WBQ08380.1 MFS transporter [Kribbella sp. CA-293567]
MTTAPAVERAQLRYFRGVVAGYAISHAGSFLSLVVLNLYVYQLTGSAVQLSIVMVTRLGASFVAGFFAGSLVARYDRKLLMISSQLVPAVALAGLVAAPPDAVLLIVYLITVVIGAGNTIFQVALRTSIPELVGPDRRVAANGSLVLARSVATVVGLSSAGIIVAWGGYTAAFGINAAAFTISALTLVVLPLRTRTASQDAEAGAAKPGWVASVREAGVLLRLTPVLLGLLIVRESDALGSASHNVALPVYATQLSPDNAAEFVGWFWAAWALGMAAAHQLTTRLLRGTELGERAFVISIFPMSAFFVAVFLGLPLPLTLACALFAGVADGFNDIAYNSRLQAAPDPQRGYLFGFSAMAETSGLGLGMLASGVLLAVSPVAVVVGAFHGLPVLMALLYGLYLFRRARRSRSTTA